MRSTSGLASPSGAGGVRLASVGHVLLALTLIGLGISGLVTGAFGAIWHSVPRSLPGREALAYVCACVSLACGVGVLFRRSAAIACAMLLGYLLLWLVLIKLPYIIASPAVAVNYESAGETGVMLAGAGVLYGWLVPGRLGSWFGCAAGERGVRGARVLYGLSLLAFGVSHFAYLKQTASLVPAWLPAHVFWVYFTGSAYLAAGAAAVIGLCARLAVSLSVVQMGLFTVLVWVLPVLAGHADAGQWSELGDSWALAAAAWVVADSLRATPWLAIGRD